MSLLADSVKVGVLTGILGSTSMALLNKGSYKEPYILMATLGTGLCGGMAYAALSNAYTPEVVALDADGDICNYCLGEECQCVPCKSCNEERIDGEMCSYCELCTIEDCCQCYDCPKCGVQVEFADIVCDVGEGGCGHRLHHHGAEERKIKYPKKDMTLEQAEKQYAELSDKINNRRYGRPNQFMMRRWGALKQLISELKVEGGAELRKEWKNTQHNMELARQEWAKKQDFAAETFSRFCNNEPCSCPGCSSVTQCDFCIVTEVQGLDRDWRDNPADWVREYKAESLSAEWDWDGLDWKYVTGDKLVYCDGCEDYCIPTWSHSAYKCQKCSQLYSRECMDRRRKDGLWCKNCKSAQFLTIWPEETFHAEGPTDDELESWSERQDDGSMLVTIDEDGDSHTEVAFDDGGDFSSVEVKHSDFFTMAAEFAADRKIRRRSRLSWERGFDPKFTVDGKWSEDAPIWQKLPFYRNPEIQAKFGKIDKHKIHYHIDLTNQGTVKDEGYYIHLWKPLNRPSHDRQWVAKMYSPITKQWTTRHGITKGSLTPQILSWYNSQIARPPEEAALTPFQRMLMQQGTIKGGVKIVRKYLPPLVRTKEDAKSLGRRSGVTFERPGRTELYYVGGDYKKPVKFLTLNDGGTPILVDMWKSNSVSYPIEVTIFLTGMLYLPTQPKIHDIRKELCSERSIKRYNKDRKIWVNSKPAWFKNMVKYHITRCNIKIDEDEEEGKVTINGHEFLQGIKSPLTSLEVHIYNHKTNEYEWMAPRPTTLDKIMTNARNSGDVSVLESIVYQCVEKYRPELNNPKIRHSMWQKSIQKAYRQYSEAIQRIAGHNNKNLYDAFGDSPRSSEMMCRRVKKKAK
tara:strand:- start:1490 stop:4057 length:2568 start_codon:yes stop_codon:yes gene_type:complete